MAHVFRIGDRVVVPDKLEGMINLRGRKGTVIARHERVGFLCVLFDKLFSGGHDGKSVGHASGVPHEVRLGRCRHGYPKELHYIGWRVNVAKLR